MKEVVVLDASEVLLGDVGEMETYIREELNARFQSPSRESCSWELSGLLVRVVRTSRDKANWGVRLSGVLDMRLGKALRKDFQAVLAAVKGLGDKELAAYQKEGKITVAGHELSGSDLTLTYVVDPEKVRLVGRQRLGDGRDWEFLPGWACGQ